MIEQSQALSPRFAKRLLAYTAMAGAGIAASTLPAIAEIVYTPTHKNVDMDFYLDLNHDGIGDFHIHSYYLSGFASLNVIPMVSGNKIAAVHHECGFRGESTAAAPLPLGAVIGPNSPFQANAQCMVHENESSAPTGPWLGVQDHYLGLEFLINGQKHFGWARISVQYVECFPCIGRIFGYAYETIPNKAIIAGDQGQAEEAFAEPTVLGALALGAPALNLWRKEENQQ
ncbi:MAG: hypothetical protein ABR874_08410 [Candidatus Sulfotelmatobacter sp.]|jgi:hypothetical protein